MGTTVVGTDYAATFVMTVFLLRMLKGVMAGVVATGAMSLVMLGAQRLGMLGEPPPRRLMRRLLPLSHGALDTAALIGHFSYGAALGGIFGLLPGRPTRVRGTVFGLGVWAANYVIALPALGLMPPALKDRPGRPNTMIASHLVYGAALAACYRALAPEFVPLRDKVIVVCGGSRGLGRALSRALIERGARVAICGRSADALERTRAWLESFGKPVLAQVCDLREYGQTAAFLDHVTNELGPVDVLVANAASIEVGPIESLNVADFDAAMREIFGTALRAALAALPQMRARGNGTIVLIASIGGKMGVPHLASYSAAKFAEVGFAEALSAEVAKDGVRVLTVFPGLMRTGSHLHAKFRGNREGEFAWFGASAIAPLVSIDADRAARRIVRAIARGDRFLTFTPTARLAAWLQDATPEFLCLLAGIAARLLPKAPAGALRSAGREGAEIIEHATTSIVSMIAARTARLADAHNQW